jgi:hypothetical protein
MNHFSKKLEMCDKIRTQVLFIEKRELMMSSLSHTENVLAHNQESNGELYLEKIFKYHSPLPAYSIFLGLCDDNVPLVLDLTDTYTGSFLIAGDDDASNFKILSTLLTAAYCFNSAKEVNIDLISSQLDDFLRLLKTPHLNLCLKPQQIETSIAIEELVNLCYQRRKGETLIPFHLVSIDGLDELIKNVDSQIRKLIAWLIENGPEVGVYVIATIESNRIIPSHFPLVECFPSRILNAVSNTWMARYLSGMRVPNLSDLTPGLDVVVFTGNKQKRIRIPQ